MAIITCYECKKEISDTAKQCPHCGATSKKVITTPAENRNQAYIILFLGYGLLGYQFYVFNGVICVIGISFALIGMYGLFKKK